MKISLIHYDFLNDKWSIHWLMFTLICRHIFLPNFFFFYLTISFDMKKNVYKWIGNFRSQRSVNFFFYRKYTSMQWQERKSFIYMLNLITRHSFWCSTQNLLCSHCAQMRWELCCVFWFFGLKCIQSIQRRCV